MGNYSSHQFAGYIEAGLNKLCGSFEVQPLVGLQYIYFNQSGFTETGAGALNLMVNSSSTNSLRSAVGARIALPYCNRRSTLIIPELRAQWMHEMIDEGNVVQSSFTSAPGSIFSARGVKLGRDFGLFGAGLTIQLQKGISILANYDLQASDKFVSHTGSGGVEFVW